MNLQEKELLKRISELESELKKIKKQKKYGLVWEDKPEQIVEDCKHNVPILRLKEKKKGIDPIVITDISKDDNILIEGDNYHALSVLNYTHKGKIDVIYIDPPYNTGTDAKYRDGGFRYSDNYINKEDSFRHSTWLSFMKKRLILSREILNSHGVIFISIDDNEQSQLKLLCDEIFEGRNFIGTLIWNKKNVVQNDAEFFSTNHEYIHCYSKNIDEVKFNLLPRSDRLNATYKNPDGDEKGPWVSVKMDTKSGSEKNNYEIIFPNGVKWSPTPGRFASYSKDKLMDLYNNGRLWFGKKGTNSPRVKVYLTEVQQGVVSSTLLLPDDVGSTQFAKETLKNILSQNAFETPKPVDLIKKLILLNTNDTGLILDFFAGSGTTGQAVLELNKKDNGNRKFILCTNNENNICEDITYERISRVIKGYINPKKQRVEGLGGNLHYYKTDLVNIEKLQQTPDHAKVKLTYQAGEMVGLRENTLNEVEKNEWWQIFEGLGKTTAIYFKEDKEKLQELVQKLEKKNQPTALYIFSWGKNEYTNEYSSKNIRVEDIPEPILEVYKEINRL